MIKTYKIRVRYSETDQMKFVHHGNYVNFFEVGRIEFFREVGISYKQLEREGIGLPVIRLEVKYHKPTFFDDEIVVRTSLKNMPVGAKITFGYEILNKKNELLASGLTDLAFMNMKTGRPMRCPEDIIKVLKPYFD